MVVFSLLIINKAGGLIYNRKFRDGLNDLSINDYLILAGTFHGVHAISTRLNPLPNPPQTTQFPTSPPAGIEVLDTEMFRLQCLQTLTGTKFLLFTEPLQSDVDKLLKKIYELYADYVMKNPFYQLEMPIKCEAFDKSVAAWLAPRQ